MKNNKTGNGGQMVMVAVQNGVVRNSFPEKAIFERVEGASHVACWE